MKIEDIHIVNFRNYSDSRIFLHPKINLISGVNGQGKTNLLEAIFFLNTGKSPRTNKDINLIGFGKTFARIEGHIFDEEKKSSLEIIIKNEFSKTKKTLLINKNPFRSFSDYLKISRVVFFSYSDMDLVAGTPEKRRKFMDLLISRINPGYLYNILNYHKVLKEKNRILFSKKQDRILIDTFNEQLVNIGSVIIKKRLDFLQEFSSLLEKLLGAIFGINKNIGLKYLSSVNIGNKDISLEYISEKFRNKIKKLAEAEFLYKKTLTGPHRDDVLFLLNNGNVRYFASSGEQLAFGLSSRLCEAIILSKDKDNPPLLILDDCLSFLDEKKQLAFWDLIRNKGQIIFASTKIPSFLSENENFSFRIDNGEIVNV